MAFSYNACRPSAIESQSVQHSGRIGRGLLDAAMLRNLCEVLSGLAIKSSMTFAASSYKSNSTHLRLKSSSPRSLFQNVTSSSGGRALG